MDEKNQFPFMRDSNNPPKKDDKNGNKSNKPNSRSWFSILLIGFFIVVVGNMLISSFTQKQTVSISYTQFINLVDAGVVETVSQEDAKYTIVIKETADVNTLADILIVPVEEEEANAEAAMPSLSLFNRTPTAEDIEKQKQMLAKQKYTTGVASNDLFIITRLESADVDFTRIYTTTNAFWDVVVTFVIPLILTVGLMWFLTRSMAKRGGGGNIMGMGKSNAKLYSMESNTGVTFKDVAGADEAKESLTEIVDFLNHPERYNKIGAKQPKGALLVGPPGTGKTMLAKAVAGEAHIAFFSLSGSEFVEMFAGVGASRVRDLFEQAQKQAPCIVFIDEIDAIGKSRDSQIGGNDEREQTLNQLLAEMDGFDSSKGIVILAATNRPEILDKALLRPGRFDRQIIVERPDLPGRDAILAVHAKKVVMKDDVDLHDIALATNGATGADLANMINEAALRAVRLGRDYVDQSDLMEAVETVIAGKEKKDRIMSEKERKIVAYHEVGHAMVSALQKDAQPVHKITIVPRMMGSLGYTMQMPEKDRYLLTKSELLAEITVLLGGRAAEQVIFKEVTTGASNDIERATEMARNMVTRYGMSDEFGMMGLETVTSQYLDGRSVSTCSEQTGEKVDQEVLKIIQGCMEKALELLEDNTDKLNEIAAFLLEKENITGKEFMAILKPEQKEKPVSEQEEITQEVDSVSIDENFGDIDNDSDPEDE